MNGKIFDPLKTELDKMKDQEINKVTEKIKDTQVKEVVNSAANAAANAVINSAEKYAESKVDEKVSEALTQSFTTKVEDTVIPQQDTTTNNPVDNYVGKIFNIPLGKIFTSTSFFVIVYLLAWYANSNMGYNFNLDDLLYLYYIVIGKNVVTYGIDSVANSKRGTMPTKPTVTQQK